MVTGVQFSAVASRVSDTLMVLSWSCRRMHIVGNDRTTSFIPTVNLENGTFLSGVPYRVLGPKREADGNDSTVLIVFHSQSQPLWNILPSIWNSVGCFVQEHIYQGSAGLTIRLEVT